LDLFQPSGHGRRRRSLLAKDVSSAASQNNTEDPWSWIELDPSIIQKHVPADVWTPEFEEQLMSARKLLNRTSPSEKDMGRRGPFKDIGQNIGVRVILPGGDC
jgi:hypothetical protein